MENVIIIVLLAAIVGCIVWYLLRAKKRGKKCIGCPYANGCGGNCNEFLGNMNPNNNTNHQ